MLRAPKGGTSGARSGARASRITRRAEQARVCRQALDACHTVAVEIRATALARGSDLDEADRRALVALASLIEQNARAKLVAGAAARSTG